MITQLVYNNYILIIITLHILSELNQSIPSSYTSYRQPDLYNEVNKIVPVFINRPSVWFYACPFSVVCCKSWNYLQIHVRMFSLNCICIWMCSCLHVKHCKCWISNLGIIFLYKKWHVVLKQRLKCVPLNRKVAILINIVTSDHRMFFADHIASESKLPFEVSVALF